MNFYKILIDEGKRKKFSEGILLDEFEPQVIQCNSCNKEWVRDPLLDKTLIFNLALTNNNYPDFAYLLYNILVSKNAKDIIVSEHIKGCRLLKINTVSSKDILPSKIKKLRDEGYKIKNIPDDPPEYYKLIVDRSAELHPKSNVKLKEKCEICGYERYEQVGDVFEQEYLKDQSWNGDDLFMVKEFGATIYCSERFVQIYNKYNLKGLQFILINSL